jgi:hypothetical protein
LDKWGSDYLCLGDNNLVVKDQDTDNSVGIHLMIVMVKMMEMIHLPDEECLNFLTLVETLVQRVDEKKEMLWLV